MARSTFKVLFYLKRQAEQNGKAPIMGRITINGTISQFSCKLSISPKLWDIKANKATGWRISRPISESSTSGSATGIRMSLPRKSRTHGWVSGTGTNSYCKHSMST